MFFRKEALEVINLSLGNQADANRFITEVRSCGEVDIWTHASYSEYLLDKPGDDQYRQERDIIMKARQKEGRPMLFLEGYNSFKELAERLKHLGFTGAIYAFTTLQADPVPLGPEHIQNISSIKFPLKQYTGCWDRLADLSSRAQLRSLQAGGEYLMFFDQEDLKNPKLNPKLFQKHHERLAKPDAGRLFDINGTQITSLPRFCVGITAVELVARGFDVSLSLPAWPNKLWRETPFYC